jgi:hypothetical protein
MKICCVKMLQRTANCLEELNKLLAHRECLDRLESAAWYREGANPRHCLTPHLQSLPMRQTVRDTFWSSFVATRRMRTLSVLFPSNGTLGLPTPSSERFFLCKTPRRGA